MIRSTGSLMAEDVTIRCTVRRTSQFAKSPMIGSCGNGGDMTTSSFTNKTDEGHEITCTMRNWETYSNSQRKKLTKVYHKLAQSALSASGGHTSHPSEPELLLTPIHQFMTDRDDSPVRTRSIKFSASSSPIPSPVTIPLSDIVLAYTFLNAKTPNNNKINLATQSLGMFEFDRLTDNAHDILYAFLQGALPPERIVDRITNDNYHDDCNQHDHEIQSKSSMSSCLGIDALHARHVGGLNETWPEKFSRRMGHVVNSLSELCDTACCIDPSRMSSTTNARQPPYHSSMNGGGSNSYYEKRDMPEDDTSHANPFLEIDDEDAAGTTMTRGTIRSEGGGVTFSMIPNAVGAATTPTSHPKNGAQKHLTKRSYDSIPMLPSGLSVEPDPDLESQYHQRQ